MHMAVVLILLFNRARDAVRPIHFTDVFSLLIYLLVLH